MEHVLIRCRDGVLYAGELLQAYMGQQKWIGIRPSSHSRIRIYFSCESVEAIYEQKGTKVALEPAGRREEGPEGREVEYEERAEVPEGREVEYEERAEVPEGREAGDRGRLSVEGKRVALIRTPGGVSFRGYLMRETEGLGEYVLAVTEACDKIVCIPPAEVERIFEG